MSYNSETEIPCAVLCLCQACGLAMACTTHCYIENWKEENKEGLRRKEGKGDSSENTESINSIQYVHNEWAVCKRAFKLWKIKQLNWNTLKKNQIKCKN